MSKRQKHPRLPNGLGSIRYLGKGRSRPYAVHPPSNECNPLTGHYMQPTAICYVKDWYTGLSVLMAYKVGKYYPGMETEIEKEVEASTANLDAFCRRVLTNASMIDPEGMTFAELYKEFCEWKFGKNAAKKLAPRSQVVYETTYKTLKPLHDIRFKDITLSVMQGCVNDSTLSRSCKKLMVTLLKQMCKYAVAHHYVDTDESYMLLVPSGEEAESGTPFSDEDLKVLWKHKDDVNVQMILIMCYSGFRISAYKDMEVNLTDQYFFGGVKTAAGKERYVPIHSAILPIVKEQLALDASLFSYGYHSVNKRIKRTALKLGLGDHSCHDCRHTFSRLCETYGVREADRKRMMGHSFGSDITNGVYGHRTVEELRTEIEKIKAP